MATFAKLSVSEVEALKKRRVSRLDLSAYATYVNALAPGEWGVVTLEEGEKQRTIKRRLTVAAKHQGKEMRYRKDGEGRIVFEVRA